MNSALIEQLRSQLAATKNSQEKRQIIESIQGSDVRSADLVLYQVESESGHNMLLAMVFPNALKGSGRIEPDESGGEGTVL